MESGRRRANSAKGTFCAPGMWPATGSDGLDVAPEALAGARVEQARRLGLKLVGRDRVAAAGPRDEPARRGRPLGSG